VLAVSFVGCTQYKTEPPTLSSVDCVESPVTTLRGKDPIRWYSAHRGLLSLFPDNSLDGIRASKDRGFPLVEVDVRPTKEKTLVLFHDSSVQGETLPNLPASVKYGAKVKDLSFDDLRAAHLPGSPTLQVPSLTEALQLVTHGCTALQLDIKDESPQTVDDIAKVVVDAGAQSHALLQFKTLQAAQGLKDRFPSLAILIRVRSEAELIQALQLHPEVIELERLPLDKELVSYAHTGGARVLYNPLGQNPDTATTARSLFGVGVDIVLTENPDATQQGL
jgi:glycerophosphoryl diester phosphodiesterase